ncbi:polysaccharide deacetylase family protein [Paenibacillus gorillae]|uniref:polysaccharide deacetylase family protein n=1 Tax=Paenibacillus gorillae TaxID=1243662 RepID=UPI0004ACA258|nr:polysaccharide deacetylase family protein [Paenibacillus gorillae]
MTIKAVWNGNENENICAFTFDDGPSRLPIEAWLDVLDEEGAVGTFFFTGEWMDRHPDRARLIISRGHVLAPHTYHHRRMAQVPKPVFLEQLKMTELAFQDATGLPCPTFMRFPYCSFREENLDWLAERNYIDIEGIDSGDWAGVPAENIFAKVEPKLEKGAIVVMHSNDIAIGSPEGLRSLIRLAKQKGLEGVGVPAILESIGVKANYRSWNISIEVPAELDHPTEHWSYLESGEQLAELADQTLEWSLTQYEQHANNREEWLAYLQQPLQAHGATEDRELFGLRSFQETHWSYVRMGVRGDTLVLLDYAAKEAQADTLVYIFRWAAETAARLGLKRIEARRDLRRAAEMCRQLGWPAEIVEDEAAE